MTPYIMQSMGSARSGERKSRALQKVDYVARTMHHCAVF